MSESFNTQPRGGGCSSLPTNVCESMSCFNTQPRGGGCMSGRLIQIFILKFQHTAARRRLHMRCIKIFIFNSFNTQPRGGGCMLLIHCQHNLQVSTHSRAEAAARIFVIEPLLLLVSTHSRAEAAAGTISRIGLIMPVSTHSRAEAAAIYIPQQEN